MSRFTPGPWTVEVHDDSTSIEGAHTTVAENVSNDDAHLLAAAPEMLELLKSAQHHFPADPRHGENEIGNRIARMIAKATGGAE